MADIWENQGVCLDFQPKKKKKKTIKNPTEPGIIFVTHGPSPWDFEWIVREKWFGQ